jgi:hypothetical protein
MYSMYGSTFSLKRSSGCSLGRGPVRHAARWTPPLQDETPVPESKGGSRGDRQRSWSMPVRRQGFLDSRPQRRPRRYRGARCRPARDGANDRACPYAACGSRVSRCRAALIPPHRIDGIEDHATPKVDGTHAAAVLSATTRFRGYVNLVYILKRRTRTTVVQVGLIQPYRGKCCPPWPIWSLRTTIAGTGPPLSCSPAAQNSMSACGRLAALSTPETADSGLRFRLVGRPP